jgi:hypothetical protein
LLPLLSLQWRWRYRLLLLPLLWSRSLTNTIVVTPGVAAIDPVAARGVDGGGSARLNQLDIMALIPCICHGHHLVKEATRAYYWGTSHCRTDGGSRGRKAIPCWT